MGCSDSDQFDWAAFLGEGDLADFIPIKEADSKALARLRNVLDDFYFEQGLADRPRGPFLAEGETTPRPQPQGPVERPPSDGDEEKPPVGGGGPPVVGRPKPRVIPCDNVIIDESDGGNGQPAPQPGNPGAPGRPGKPRIIEIPPGLANCVFTQHHQTDGGIGWTVIVRIQNGRIKQVIVTFEQGRAVPVSTAVGDIIKVHKDNNKITVVGKKRVCTYYVKTSQLICLPPV